MSTDSLDLKERERAALAARTEARNQAAIERNRLEIDAAQESGEKMPPETTVARAERHIARLIEARKKRKDNRPIASPDSGANAEIIGPNGEIDSETLNDDEFADMPLADSFMPTEPMESMGEPMESEEVVTSDEQMLGMLNADSGTELESEPDSLGRVEPAFDIQDARGIQDDGEFRLDPLMEVTEQDVKELNELLSSTEGGDEFLELLK
jgi:hypothetical protein